MDRRKLFRGLTTMVIGVFVAVAVAVGAASTHPRTASAAPLFTQCPPVGLDTGCAVLITLGPGGSMTTAVDPTQPPFDGVEDTLVGVQNNSGGTVTSINLSGASGASPAIFDLDNDGLCAGYVPGPAGCPYGDGASQNYAGRATNTPVGSGAATTFPAETYTNISADKNSGTVNFLNPTIPNGGSAYFSLEGPTSSFAPCSSGVPATVMLSPLTGTNPVGTQHTVTATVNDLCSAPVSGATVHFTVTETTGNVITGMCTTGAAGTCTFTYTGPILPATDAISGCAGPSGAPPCGAATKAWVLPVSACNGDITYGGHMTADNGDRVNFGGVAHSDEANPPSGEETFIDMGANLQVHSTGILAITCSAEKADIYGIATENGTGSHLFRIEVTDPDSSGGADTYWIVLDNYNSGSHPIQGNVEIHST
ncbi:MAG: hypothetical protein E6J20_16595 [Chloroflexi bacterium]|nr:MAG: hypothetical protein E6J20_16595 [Chloroflexota bacterium]